MLALKWEEISDKSENEYVGIQSLAELLSLGKSEMENLIYYLKRGEIVKTDNEKNSISFTEYGKMIYCENYGNAFAPIIC